MHKIIIVDDEIVVREGIRENINWDEMGFELVGDYENGRDAMAAVDALMPDVVLTDICMPHVDGLKLGRYIMEKYPYTRVVFLTGFDEFEYAQEAVKLKACDYLIKPITASELREVLAKLKAEIDEHKQKLSDMERQRTQLRESLPLLKERFLNRLLTGNLREGELERRLKYLNISLSGACYTVLAVDIDDQSDPVSQAEDDGELSRFVVSNICEELAEPYGGVVTRNRQDRILLILPGERFESLAGITLGIAETIRMAAEQYMDFTVTIGIGLSCNHLNDIVISSRSALSALDYRYILGKNRVISSSQIGQNPASYRFNNLQWQKKLIASMKGGTPDEVNKVIDGIVNELKSTFVPVERCSTYVQQTILSILSVLDELSIDECDVFDDANPFAEVYGITTLDDISVKLKAICKRATDAMLLRRSDHNTNQVKKAEEFLLQNYADKDLSLHSVCKHLFISTSYFSFIFKSSTGETFVEYLTRIRVEKAMQLFKTTALKTYEVADSVGYADPHYFSMIFKKANGVSPTEYREMLSKENGE